MNLLYSEPVLLYIFLLSLILIMHAVFLFFTISKSHDGDAYLLTLLIPAMLAALLYIPVLSSSSAGTP